MGFLIDEHGRKIPTRLESKMIDLGEKLLNQLKSGGTSNAFRGWLSDDADANLDNKDLPTARNRAKDLDDNSPLANGAVKRVTTTAISGGLRLQSQLNAKRLGMSDKQAQDKEDEIEERFDAWASENDSNLTREYNFYVSQSLAFKSSLVFGDCFSLLLNKKYPGVDNDLKFKLIEAPQCSSPHSIDTVDGTLIDGIERDKSGALVAFHFQKSHPGAENPTMGWAKIPAFGKESGRKNVLHIKAILDRIGQVRPRPFLSPCMEEIKQISRYADYEVMAALVNASLTIFLNQQTPTTAGMPTPIGAAQQVTNDTVTDADGKTERDINYEIGSGNVIEGEADDKVTVVNPSRPNVNFDQFVKSMASIVGSSLEIPMDILLLLFSRSYTASRAAMIEFWKFVFGRRTGFTGCYNQPIYETWFEMETISGRLSAPNFFANNLFRKAWLGSRWVGRGQPLLDPGKERKGQIEAIKWALDDFDNIYTQTTGPDWAAAMRRRKRQNEILKENGIVLPKKGNGNMAG